MKIEDLPHVLGLFPKFMDGRGYILEVYTDHPAGTEAYHDLMLKIGEIQRDNSTYHQFDAIDLVPKPGRP